MEKKTLTYDSCLSFLLRSAAQNEAGWLHRSKMFRRVKSQTDIGPYDDDSFTRKVLSERRYFGQP